ncbi:MAG: ABC1 kinase family protein [Sphaerospermopsis kisseleviana]|uniref:ABC-1 domain-containing protein n=2 Tax=Sphaerospermopsis TaxID=752201 RepID=A0A480A185_9CYAN|nr:MULTISPECIES: AarF/ABC1/UbiB kinase family protein [Sphaerospermopsis]MBC5797358.1 AarF/ABC1/UbiB kinase family protein [Sphaerospermopsis sp. LEGE 00249]MBD2133825.1 AarF/ABC1/UbiB kinase family protein [Sphaerospermopsis sp. FACHB-1094]MBD2147989.1 AarF/ABC1/UbiB kinase family protein [Sphaerospermopsis sp. FACHB-1194]BAZ80473.1 ABC-1 domain-containing protein [Sphaerospermopsis kisseleviana NIES-73]MDB9440647.1 AarF/ABC1/UbiB kinase family protein [Sphaerospermopsis kisseleviana CS-549]
MGQYQPAQLKQYNPEAIARYYRYRPWLAWGRLLRIIFSFAGFLLSLKWDEWQNQVEQNKGKRATQLRQLLTNLGPTFIKVGQALSTRPDLIRKDFLEELVKLQDQLPPFDHDLAQHIIETELNRSIDEIFSELSPKPVAAASLGQVYRGRLITGEEVAVKVQRPHLRPVITKDLYLMRWAATWLSPWLPLNLGHDLTLIVDEFGTKLFEEIDYMNEGRNAEKFATNFRDDPQVKVPTIYWRYSSNRVLTLEWINGFKLTDIQSIRQAGLDPETIIQIGVTSGLQQLLEHGFFHADPHPGNLFAVPDGRMAYIDFGMMDQLEETTKETLVDALVHLVNKDYTDLAEDFVKLGFLAPKTNIAPIVPALEAVLGNAIGKNVGDFNFKTITDEFSELMYEYPFRVPAKFALIIRSLVTQEGIALTLNPNFKIVEVGYPYIARRLLTGESPALRRRLLNVLFKDGKFQWQRLENLISIARTDQQFDVVPTARMGLQYLLSEEGKFLRRQLVLALTEDDRLHTDEVQRLWDLVKDDLPPNRLLNVAVGILTELSRESVAAILPKATSLISFTEKQ